ncbi:MAG: DotA/TraY family protein [Gluconacetobacter sp.]
MTRRHRPVPRLALFLALGWWLFLPGVGYAADGTVWTTLATDDWSLTVLNGLFPVGSSADTTTGQMLKTISLLISGLAAIYITYAMLLRLHAASETGKLITEQFNGWVAPRYLLASLMIVPVAGLNGLNVGQFVIVKALAPGAVNGARLVNSGIINAIGPRALPLALPMVPGTRETVQGVIQAEMCRALINAATGNAHYIPAPSMDGALAGNTRVIRYGNGVCGVISLQASGQKSGSSGLSVPDISADQAKALTDMIGRVRSKVAPIAAAMWANHSAAGLAGLNAVLVDETSRYTQDLVAASSKAISKVRSGAASDGGSGTQDAGVKEMQSLGWAGAAAYYLQIAKLNAQVLSQSVLLPDISSPNYRGIAGSLALDIRPYVVALDRYQADQAASITLTNPTSVPGQPADLEASGAADSPTALSAPIDWVLKTVHLNDYLLTTIMSQLVAPAAGSGWSDPFASLIHLGHVLIHASVITLAAVGIGSSTVVKIGEAISTAANAVVGDLPGAAASAGAFVGSTLLSKLFTPICAALIGLLGPGLILAFVLPLMPFSYFFVGIMGWFVVVIEAVIAFPFGGLAHLVLAGEGLHGKAHRVYEVLFHILCRPMLMLAGLVVSYTLFAAGSWFLMKGFSIAAGFVLGNGYLVDNLLGLIVLLSVFTSMEIALAHMAFRLIATIPHHATTMAGFGPVGRVDNDRFVEQTTGAHSQRGTTEQLRETVSDLAGRGKK